MEDEVGAWRARLGLSPDGSASGPAVDWVSKKFLACASSDTEMDGSGSTVDPRMASADAGLSPEAVYKSVQEMCAEPSQQALAELACSALAACPPGGRTAMMERLASAAMAGPRGALDPLMASMAEVNVNVGAALQAAVAAVAAGGKFSLEALACLVGMVEYTAAACPGEAARSVGEIVASSASPGGAGAECWAVLLLAACGPQMVAAAAPAALAALAAARKAGGGALPEHLAAAATALPPPPREWLGELPVGAPSGPAALQWVQVLVARRFNAFDGAMEALVAALAVEAGAAGGASVAAGAAGLLWLLVEVLGEGAVLSDPAGWPRGALGGGGAMRALQSACGAVCRAVPRGAEAAGQLAALTPLLQLAGATAPPTRGAEILSSLGALAIAFPPAEGREAALAALEEVGRAVAGAGARGAVRGWAADALAPLPALGEEEALDTIAMLHYLSGAGAGGGGAGGGMPGPRGFAGEVEDALGALWVPLFAAAHHTSRRVARAALALAAALPAAPPAAAAPPPGGLPLERQRIQTAVGFFVHTLRAPAGGGDAHVAELVKSIIARLAGCGPAATFQLVDLLLDFSFEFWGGSVARYAARGADGSTLMPAVSLDEHGKASPAGGAAGGGAGGGAGAGGSGMTSLIQEAGGMDWSGTLPGLGLGHQPLPAPQGALRPVAPPRAGDTPGAQAALYQLLDVLRRSLAALGAAMDEDGTPRGGGGGGGGGGDNLALICQAVAEQIQERVGGGHDRVPGWGAYEEALPRPPQGYSWHQTVTEALAANPFLAGVLRVLGELAPGSLVGAVPLLRASLGAAIMRCHTVAQAQTSAAPAARAAALAVLQLLGPTGWVPPPLVATTGALELLPAADVLAILMSAWKCFREAATLQQHADLAGELAGAGGAGGAGVGGRAQWERDLHSIVYDNVEVLGAFYHLQGGEGAGEAAVGTRG